MGNLTAKKKACKDYNLPLLFYKPKTPLTIINIY